MRNVATSVRIPEDASDILSELAAKLGKSKAKVIETALKELEEKIFWNDVRSAFERSAADPAESARERVEMELWDGTSDRDFRDEKW